MTATDTHIEASRFVGALGAPAALIARDADGTWRRVVSNLRLGALEDSIGPVALDGPTLSLIERCASTGEATEDIVTRSTDAFGITLRRSFVVIGDQAAGRGPVMMTVTEITGQAAPRMEISEREKRFRDFTESASDGFWETDANFRFVWMKARIGDRPMVAPARQFGLTPDEVMAQAGAVSESPRRITEIMAAREPLSDYVYSFEREDGRAWRVIDGRPFYDSKGRFCGYRGVVRDITESRRHMAAMEEARQRAEQADRAKSRFLAAATHDLRQPLQAAIMFHAVLQRLDLPAEGRDGLDKLGRSLTALQDMLSRLLDISRLDAGVIVPDRHAFPISPLLDRLVDLYGPVAAGNGVSLRSVDSSATIVSDPHLLDRILENIVSNAVKYTRRGRVLIGCRRVGGQLAIRVHDTGPGIAEAEQKAIFEEFRRGGNAPGDFADGLGIGLAIVERLGKLLDHPIALASRPGDGTMVEVRVPLLESTLRFARQDTALHPAEPASMRSTVLVIDDDAAVRESLSMAMVASGYRVLTAASGAEALNRASEAIPGLDAVIADLGLGRGPDGIEVVRALRERLGRPVPALLLTGDTTPERLRDIAESGLAVVHKPVLPDVLGAMVNRLVDS